MKQVSITEAKAHFSKLVDEAAKGEPFIIAKNGKPVAKVVAIDAPATRKVRRIGFMKGQFSVPEDFDTMVQKEIEDMFERRK
ncbi:MAG: type II toxin-antitoxin system Phd/YefM family antitoxin [Terriglobales bacterium]